LVEYVRKRDPRYQKYTEYVSAQNDARRVEAQKRAARDRAKFVAGLQQYTEQEWARVDKEEEIVETDEDEEDEIEEEYMCNKTFKHENAWLDYERSKKHLKNVYTLKRMTQEDAALSDKEENKC
jgi:hypothetical protein